MRRLFESIFKYVKDLLRYLEDLEEGVYIQVRACTVSRTARYPARHGIPHGTVSARHGS